MSVCVCLSVSVCVCVCVQKIGPWILALAGRGSPTSRSCSTVTVSAFIYCTHAHKCIHSNYYMHTYACIHTRVCLTPTLPSHYMRVLRVAMYVGNWSFADSQLSKLLDNPATGKIIRETVQQCPESKGLCPVCVWACLCVRAVCVSLGQFV